MTMSCAGTGRTLRSLRFSRPGRLALQPQFEVLRSVVGFVPILVMDRLAGRERAAEHLFHDHPMLLPPSSFPAQRRLDPDIALPVGKREADRALPPRGLREAETLASPTLPLALVGPLALTPSLADFLCERPRGDGTCPRAKLAISYVGRRELGPTGTAGSWGWVGSVGRARLACAVYRRAWSRAELLMAVEGPERASALDTYHVWNGARTPYTRPGAWVLDSGS